MEQTAGLPELAIDGKIARITLRRPGSANRLGPDDLRVFGELLEVVNGSDALVLQINATGKYFCSGFDLGQITNRPTDSGFERYVNALEDCRPATIAAINGGVYGGATDLALACDFRLGTPDVDMFMPAARLGLHFYGRGLERYVSRLGVDVAKEMFLSCRTYTADELLACGFLTELTERNSLISRSDELAGVLAAMAPIPLLGMKKHLNLIARRAADAETIAADVRRAAASQDLVEGSLAWREKRNAVFIGR